MQNNGQFFAFISLLLALAFFTITLVNDKSLSSCNRLWMQFGLLLSLITSPVICGLIFIIIFTPLGILMRVAGRDELKLKTKELSSYWIIKDLSDQSPSFKFQF
jgi:ABC-type molybdate transport system permease subunit